MFDGPKFGKNYVVGQLDSSTREMNFIPLNDKNLAEVMLGYLSPFGHTIHYANTGIEGQMIKRPDKSTVYDVPITRFRRQHSERLIKSGRVVGAIKPETEQDIRGMFLKKAKEIDLDVILNEPVKPEYLDIDSETIERLQDGTLEANFKTGAITFDDPDYPMVYMRTTVFSGEKVDKEGHYLPGLGVDNTGHRKVLQVVCFNVKPYLGEGKNPNVLVFKNPQKEDGGIILPLGNFKVSHNYTILAMGKDEAKIHGFDEAVFYRQGDMSILEGGGEALFYVDEEGTLRATPLGLGVLDSNNRQHLIDIAKTLGIPFDDKEPTHLDAWMEMPGHIMVGTWAEFVTPEVIYRPSTGQISRPDLENAVVIKLKDKFIKSINGIATGNSKIDSLTVKALTPLNFLAEYIPKS